MINHNGNNKNGFKYRYWKRGVTLAKALERYKVEEFYNLYEDWLNLDYLPYKENINKHIEDIKAEKQKIQEERRLFFVGSEKNTFWYSEKQRELIEKTQQVVIDFCTDALKDIDIEKDKDTFEYCADRLKEIIKERNDYREKMKKNII